MKLALDPFMFRRIPLNKIADIVARLGYQYIELSSRPDFLPLFTHATADKGMLQVSGYPGRRGHQRSLSHGRLPLVRPE